MYSLCYKSRPEAIDMFFQFACILGSLCQLRQGGFLPQGIILLHPLVLLSRDWPVSAPRKGGLSLNHSSSPPFSYQQIYTQRSTTNGIYLYATIIVEVGCRVKAISWQQFPKQKRSYEWISVLMIQLIDQFGCGYSSGNYRLWLDELTIDSRMTLHNIYCWKQT